MSVKLQLPPIDSEDVFEDFVLDLYNKLYSSSSFQKFGKKGNKQKGIDIVSISEKIAIQCKKKQITRRNIKTELKQDFEADLKASRTLKSNIKTLIFVSTFSDSANLSEYLQELKNKYSISFDLIYIGWETLASYVQNYPDLLYKYFGEYLNRRIRTPFPYFDKDLLLGREKLLDELQLNIEKNDLIVIQGIGGVGKTCLVSTYLKNSSENFNNIIWIEHQLDTIKDSVFESLGEIFKVQGEDYTLQKNWKFLLQKLNEANGINIIILDGIEEKDETIYDLLDDILSTSWKVLVTSRIKLADYFTMTLEGLPLQSAKLLFKRFYTLRNAIEEEFLEKILIEIDFHPLLVELLAKATQSNPKITLKFLLELLIDSRLNDYSLQNSINVGKHAKYRKARREQQIYTYLLMCFNLDPLNKEEKLQLSFFAFLPSSTAIDFTWYIKITGQKKGISSVSNILNQLEIKGWINNRNNEFYIHPLIQIVIREKLNISSKTIKKIIIQCTKQLAHHQDYNLQFLQKYYSIAKNILTVLPLDNLTLLLAQFYGTVLLRTGNYERSIRHCEECVDFLKSHQIYDPNLVSSFSNNLANAYAHVGLYEKAMALFINSIETAQLIDNEKLVSLARSLDNFATVLEKMGKYEDAIVLTKNAIGLFKQCNQKKDLGVAYINLANTYSHIEEFKRALFYAKKGQSLLNFFYDENNPLLGESYNTLGLIYIGTKRAKKARDCFEKALAIYKNENNPESLSMCYSNIGIAKLMLDQLEEANNNFDLALNLYLSLEKGNDQNLGMILLNKADYYFSINDIHTAKKTLKEALKVLKNVIPSDHPLLEKVKEQYQGVDMTFTINYYSNKNIVFSLSALKEQIAQNLKLYRDIIDTYGEVKVIKYSSESLEDILHDYVFFCFTKSCKTLFSILLLIQRKLPEDAMILLYSFYRTYLSIVFLHKHPGKVCQIISFELNNRNRSKDIKRDNNERSKFPDLNKLVEESPYSEDIIVHEYIYSHLNDHAKSSFIVSGNYRDKEENHYIYSGQELIMQPVLLTAYLEILLIKEIVKFLKEDFLKERIEVIHLEDIPTLKAAINKMEFEDEKIRKAMIKRLESVL